jgi:hypothetical protein
MWRSGEEWACLFAWKFNVIRSAVMTGCFSVSLLANRLKIPPTKVLALHYSGVCLDGLRKSKKTISCSAKNLLVSQEGLSSKEIVNVRISPLIISLSI